ncbi:hypothetical protein [Planococcus liqunii]|uniref:hypothetical protein n=1 Tax=Planococcus liqunii TaxID=3058394 RepID=UPI00387E3CC8
MFRKIVILIGVVFFMALILFTGMMFLKNETEVYSQGGIALAIEKPTFFTLSDSKETKEGPDVTHAYEISLFGLALGSYTLVERTLDNEVKIVFEEVTNTGWMPFAVSLNTKNLEEAKVKSWHPEPVQQAQDDTYGADPTTNPYGTIATGEGEILQGNLYVSRPITLGNGEAVNELRHEIPNMTLEEGQLAKSFWLPPKHEMQTWFMLSPEPFFSSEADEDKWISHALQNRREQLNWLTPEGPLVKIPLTEDLRTEMAYAVIDERTQDAVSAEWNQTAPSLFFESMMQNAKATAE